MRLPRRARHAVTLILLVACAALSACTEIGVAPGPTPPPGPADPLRAIARREGDVRVVVVLAVDQERPGVWNRREIARAGDRLLREVRPGVRVVRRVEELPQLVLRLTAPALERLRASDLVLDITLDQGR